MQVNVFFLSRFVRCLLTFILEYTPCTQLLLQRMNGKVVQVLLSVLNVMQVNYH